MKRAGADLVRFFLSNSLRRLSLRTFSLALSLSAPASPPSSPYPSPSPTAPRPLCCRCCCCCCCCRCCFLSWWVCMACSAACARGGRGRSLASRASSQGWLAWGAKGSVVWATGRFGRKGGEKEARHPERRDDARLNRMQNNVLAMVETSHSRCHCAVYDAAAAAAPAAATGADDGSFDFVLWGVPISAQVRCIVRAAPKTNAGDSSSHKGKNHWDAKSLPRFPNALRADKEEKKTNTFGLF